MKRRGTQQNAVSEDELNEFLSAITSHDFDTTSRILTTYPFLVRYKDERGATPLHMAATVLDEKIIKLLLDNGADVNSLDNQGLTALHNASLCNVVGREDVRPFIEYAEESFKTLLDGGANPNARTTDGLTPLHVLVSSGTVVPDEVLSSLASVLIDNGADPTLENDAKQTALDSIIAKKASDIEYSLTVIDQDRNNRKPPEPSMTSEEKAKFQIKEISEMHESPLIKSLEVFKPAGDLIRAIKANDYDEISRIITDHPEALKFQGENGNTPLHIALAEKGCSVETVDLVYKTMDENDRRNIRNKQGVSAQDMVDVIGYIAKEPTLQKKIEILNNDPQLVFVKTRDGKTLIDEELKLNKGLKPEDIAQGYFLMRLIDNNKQEAAVSLIKTNPHLVNFRDSNGDSILHHAIHSSNGRSSKVTTALMENGANPGILNKAGLSARDTMAGYALSDSLAFPDQKTGKIDIKKVKSILKQNPKLKDFRDFEGSTLLHYAVFSKNPDTITLLLEKGLDVNARDNDGRTPLHNLATSFSNEGYKFEIDNAAQLLQELITRNANIEARDNDGNNFLHAMAISGVGFEDLEALVKKLYLHKDILNIPNNDGKTCKDIVEGLKLKQKHREISTDSEISNRAVAAESHVSLSSDSSRSPYETAPLSDYRKSSADGLLFRLSSSSASAIFSNLRQRFSKSVDYVMSFVSSSTDRQSSSSSDYQDAQLGSRSTSSSNGRQSSVKSTEFYSTDDIPASRNPSAKSLRYKVSKPHSPNSTAIDFEALDKGEQVAVKAAGDAFDALYERGGDRGLVHKPTKRISSSYKPRGSFMEH